MRIAIVSDIHGNLTALEAVIADLGRVAPDVVLHGGDLADSGSRPVEVVDRVRGLGWTGVMGNTDEMLVRPQSLEAFAAGSQAPAAVWAAVREIAAATRDVLGEERLRWIEGLPMVVLRERMAVVHASPENCWVTPEERSPDQAFEDVYGVLDRETVVFGHTHRSSIRKLGGRVKLLVNAGSVGLPHDGDPRASYAVVTDGEAEIRRVAYDVEAEIEALRASGLPGAAWTEKMLRASGPTMP